MAITVTDRGDVVAADDVSHTSVSFTPADGTVLFAVLYGVNSDSGSPTFGASDTFSDVGTWATVPSSRQGTSRTTPFDISDATEIYYAVVGTGNGSGTVTVTMDASVGSDWFAVTFLEVAGVDTSDLWGLSGTFTSTGADTSPGVDLGATPTSDSLLIGVHGAVTRDDPSGSPAATIPSGWTETQDAVDGGLQAIVSTGYRNGSGTQTPEWTNVTGGNGYVRTASVIEVQIAATAAAVVGTPSSSSTDSATGAVTATGEVVGTATTSATDSATGVVTATGEVVGTATTSATDSATGVVGTAAAVVGTPSSSSTDSATGVVTATGEVVGTATTSATDSATGVVGTAAAVVGTPSSSSTDSATGVVTATGEVVGTATTSATDSATGVVTATGEVVGTATSSATSSETGVVVGADVPDAPAQPVVASGDDAALIDWLEPADNGDPITGYKIERNVNGGGFSTLVADTGNTLLWYRDDTVSNGTAYQYRLSAINSGGTSSASTASASSTPTAKLFGTSISGRDFLDQNGDPWCNLGDAGVWANLLTASEQNDYLDDLVTRDFNALRLKPADGGHFGDEDLILAPDADGNMPFEGTGVLADWFVQDLNQPWWDAYERLVSAARVRGITCFLTATWTGFDNDEGTGDEMAATTDTVMRSYGEDVGNIFASYPNVMWLLGGDTANPLSSTLQDRLTAVYNGIVTDAGSTQPVAIHGRRGVDPDAYSLDNLNDFSYYYDDPAGNYSGAYANATNGMAMVFGEGYYDNEHGLTGTEARVQIWSAFCQGMQGIHHGNGPRYHFAKLNTEFGHSGTLADTWNDTGTVCMGIFNGAIVGFSGWGTTVPDTGGTFVVSGQAVGRFDGDAAIVYVSSGSHDLDLTEFATNWDTMLITRLDPTDGTETTHAANASTSDATYTIADQSTNGDGDTDWVYLISGSQAAAAEVVGTPSSSSTDSATGVVTATGEVVGTPTSSSTDSATGVVGSTGQVVGTASSSSTDSATGVVGSTGQVVGTASSSSTDSATGIVGSTGQVVGTASSSSTDSATGIVGSTGQVVGTASSSSTDSATGIVGSTGQVVGTASSSSTDSATGIVGSAGSVTGTPTSSTTSSATGVVTSTSEVVGTESSSATDSATGNVGLGSPVVGTPSSSATSSETGVVTGTTEVAGTASTSATSSGTGVVTATGEVVGTPSSSATASATGPVGTTGTVIGTPSTSTTDSETGAVTGTTEVVGTATTSATSSATGVVSSTVTVIGTPSTSATDSATGVVTATGEVIGTPSSSATDSETGAVGGPTYFFTGKTLDGCDTERSVAWQSNERVASTS